MVAATSLSAEVKARWYTSHQPVAAIFSGLTQLCRTIMQIEGGTDSTPTKQLTWFRRSGFGRETIMVGAIADAGKG
jgi:hypothetical protein